jgi:hypothetical protein
MLGRPIRQGIADQFIVGKSFWFCGEPSRQAQAIFDARFQRAITGQPAFPSEKTKNGPTDPSGIGGRQTPTTEERLAQDHVRWVLGGGTAHDPNSQLQRSHLGGRNSSRFIG